ncbi:MAG TPA: hypothetical protein VN222_14785 [Novosphingobium sp.]|nr:hypothetical protein [Novosphingobium sp.]
MPASEGNRINALMGLEDAAALIRAGAPLAIAGREAALDRLPAGNWIAGTTPYFMTADGGRRIDANCVFVTDLSGLGDVRVATYGEDELGQITEDAPENGFALAIIPFQSACHERFAKEASSYPQAFLKPTVGWIAGFDLDEAGASASVYDGRTSKAYANQAVVLHVTLPAEACPMVEIVNLFEADGVDTIRFEEAGFNPARAVVNGEQVDFAEYVNQRGLSDGSLPLVGDYAGARINSSIQKVAAGHVELYAPVFAGIDYAFARPVPAFADTFRARLDETPHDGALWSCNCILNYVFGGLEGQAIGGCAGPVTFGEIAYQLINQTLVQVRAI